MIIIIDIGVGNVGSIQNMLNWLGAESQISSNPLDIEKADALILPGVGSYDHGVVKLKPFVEVLNKRVIVDKIPFLGVCLGMQLLLNSSDEGELAGLGWIQGHAAKFNFKDINSAKKLRIPHMGWNEVWPSVHSRLLALPEEGRERFYFVHSFHATDVPDENIMAWCHYGYDFVCAIQKDNIMGAQFHPEKSHKFGKRMFKRFVELSQC